MGEWPWTGWQKHLDPNCPRDKRKLWIDKVDRAGYHQDHRTMLMEQDARGFLLKGPDGLHRRKFSSFATLVVLIVLITAASFSTFTTAVGIAVAGSICQVSKEYGVLVLLLSIGFMIQHLVTSESADATDFSMSSVTCGWAAIYIGSSLLIWWVFTRWGVHASARLVPRLDEYLMHFLFSWDSTALARDQYGMPREDNRRDGASKSELIFIHSKFFIIGLCCPFAAASSFVAVHHLRAAAYPIEVEWWALLCAALSVGSCLMIQILQRQALLLRFPALQREPLFRIKARLPYVVASSLVAGSVAPLAYAAKAGYFISAPLSLHLMVCGTLVAVNVQLAVTMLQVYLTKRMQFLDDVGCVNPNCRLIAGLKASDLVECGLLRAHAYLDLCQLVQHDRTRWKNFLHDHSNSASEVIQAINLYLLAPIANDLDELSMADEFGCLANESALGSIGAALHAASRSSWKPQAAIRNPLCDAQLALWAVKALASLLQHATDPRQPDRRGYVLDHAPDIAAHLARLKCSLTDYHAKLRSVTTKINSDLLPLSADYSALLNQLELSLASIVTLFHGKTAQGAPLLPQHAIERRKTSLHVHDANQVPHSGNILEMHELPAAMLTTVERRDPNNQSVKISVPKAVPIWQDEPTDHQHAQDQLANQQRALGDALFNLQNGDVACDRLGEILHQEADLYVEMEEMRRELQRAGAPEVQQPALWHEKDAMRHRFGEFDPLRSRQVGENFRTPSLNQGGLSFPTALPTEYNTRGYPVIAHRQLAIGQELEKLQHEKHVLTEGDGRLQQEVAQARDNIKFQNSQVQDSAQKIQLKRTCAMQLLEKLRRQVQLHEDFMGA